MPNNKVSKYNPAALKRKGRLGDSFTPNSTDYHTKHGGMKHDKESKNREGLRKALISLKFTKTKNYLKPFSSLFPPSFMESENYGRFLMNACELFYGNEYAPFEIRTLDINPEKQFFLLMLMGTAQLVNASVSGRRIGVEKEDLISNFKTFAADLREVSKTTNKPIDEVVNDGIESYSRLSALETIDETLQTVFNHLVIPIIATPLAGAVIGKAVAVESKKVTGKQTPQTQVSYQEFESFLNNIWRGINLKQISQQLESSKNQGKLKSLLTMVDNRRNLSAFYVAINQKNIEAVKLILEAVKDNPKLLKKILLTRYTSYQMNAFYFAANQGETEVVKLMLEAVKNDPKLLKKILLTPYTTNQESAFYTAASLGRTETIKSMLEAVKDNPELLEKMLLIHYTPHQVSAFYGATNLGNIEVIKLMLEAAKNNQPLLEKMLLTFYHYDKQSAFYSSANQGNTVVIKLMLEAAKDNPELLEKMLLTSYTSHQESAFYTAASLGRTETIKSMLEAVKDNPELLEKMLLTSYSRNQVSAFYVAANHGETEVVKLMLEAAKDNKPLLEKMLLTTYHSDKHSAFYSSANQGNTEVVKLMLEATKDNQPLLEKMLLTTYTADKLSAFYNAIVNDRPETVSAILEFVKHNPTILEALVNNYPKEYGLSVVNNLIIAGNWDALKIIMEHSTKKIEVENLPASYHANIPKATLYYAESFLRDKEIPTSATKVSYYQFQNNSPKEVSLDKITLSKDKSEPILVKLNYDNDVRKTILVGQIIIHKSYYDKSMSDSVSSLERAMELAKTNNVNNVVVNIALDITGVSHTISLKLSKNKDKKWKAVFYDSNDIITDTNKNALETLIKKAGIEGKLEKSPVVIPNTKEGHCDMISYITSAALTFGNEHVNNVRNHCNKLRATCAKTLGEKLNTEIHETLKAKLDEFAKSQLKKEESKDPPKSITKATDCKMIAEIQQICGIDEYEGIGR